MKLSFPALILLLSSCTPWSDNYSHELVSSKTLNYIGFYGNGIGTIYNSLSDKDKLVAEHNTDRLMESLGSVEHLSLSAVDFLQKDGFVCSYEACVRMFVMRSVFGLRSAFGFSPGTIIDQSWKFVIKRNDNTAHFTSIIFEQKNE